MVFVILGRCVIGLCFGFVGLIVARVLCLVNTLAGYCFCFVCSDRLFALRIKKDPVVGRVNSLNMVTV